MSHHLSRLSSKSVSFPRHVNPGHIYFYFCSVDNVLNHAKRARCRFCCTEVRRDVQDQCISPVRMQDFDITHIPHLWLMRRVIL
ncbi:hypothetical protein TNIN_132901 [Trichonephila inaurata madagascariensis]|uniref:Uncharacterized protein n=1 Tax=Trichonephila inaurata madagascariensis TaxID=2747483 RepID=A0A8X6JIR2_9ARAC|nr:hypothetical protein TNIN_132901 [Trichonephila inaurata madagascariensis]